MTFSLANESYPSLCPPDSTADISLIWTIPLRSPLADWWANTKSLEEAYRLPYKATKRDSCVRQRQEV